MVLAFRFVKNVRMASISFQSFDRFFFRFHIFVAVYLVTMLLIDDFKVKVKSIYQQ